MFKSIKVSEVELSQPIGDIENLEGYYKLKLLVRLYGTPLGIIDTPIKGDYCPASTIYETISHNLKYEIIKTLLNNTFNLSNTQYQFTYANIVNARPIIKSNFWPKVTVAICSRNRSLDLKICLDSILKLDYPNLDILVIDNAPSNSDTENLVIKNYTSIRYICEPRPGLNWARNRAIIESQGEIIAYTDDDVIVDSGWIKNLVIPFMVDTSVMAVTGLVIPYELETEAQFLFELYGGFGRGFSRRWNKSHKFKNLRREYLGTGQFGTGANMSYRREVFYSIGLFDPALDVGTVTNGGGDLEMFFRVLKEGYTLVYEPAALVRHRHRREFNQLYTQITNNGIGLYSYFKRSCKYYKDERFNFFKFGIWWFNYWLLRRLVISYLRPDLLSRSLIFGEIKGSFLGLIRYKKAQKDVRKIKRKYGDLDFQITKASNNIIHTTKNKDAIAIRFIDLKYPLFLINDVINYNNTIIFITWGSKVLGKVNISNCYHAINELELRDAIVDQLFVKILSSIYSLDEHKMYEELFYEVKNHFLKSSSSKVSSKVLLPTNVSVSIVIATYDRPDDLNICLENILSQKTSRKVEIIVVDNHPESGLTPPVINDFPTVKLISEKRKGLSYARNAGINVSKGEIIITTDDDVLIPEDWIDTLTAPFVQNDIMIVTGNIIPAELNTNSQILFEEYGGLGKGYSVKKVDYKWFEKFRIRAVPTWELGATANAAFRSSLFNDPKVGLFYEALGAGMPTGVGEDTYIFYKALKVGYTLYYEPSAFVVHKHRKSIKTLRKQIFNYSKGHVAYHLITVIKDKDLRAIFQLIVQLPLGHIWRIIQRIRRKNKYSFLMQFLEIIGNILGPFSLIQALIKVKRYGRSKPSIQSSMHN